MSQSVVSPSFSRFSRPTGSMVPTVHLWPRVLSIPHTRRRRCVNRLGCGGRSMQHKQSGAEDKTRHIGARLAGSADTCRWPHQTILWWLYLAASDRQVLWTSFFPSQGRLSHGRCRNPQNMFACLEASQGRRVEPSWRNSSRLPSWSLQSHRHAR
jgi:hypothetical protein